MDDDNIDNLPQPKDHATLVYIDSLKHGNLKLLPIFWILLIIIIIFRTTSRTKKISTLPG